MGLEVVDGIKRFIPEDGEHAGGEGTDEKRAKQTGTVSDGDIINVVFRQVCVIESFMYYW